MFPLLSVSRNCPDEPLFLFGIGFKTRAALGDVSFGAAENLAAVVFGFVHDFGDFGVVIVEHFAKQVHRPLDRIQILEQDEERGGEGFGQDGGFDRGGFA
jgi:hypothetical protein